ncbi:Archaeal shikimate kinase [Halanaeroarchaeum sp. HSR-CO]|uniref:shikimate kinase n=1 Tax=Halanaeroarchaeum sp. HSR-CO TaxID=2866382 RepID=UPI00217D7903|nr:shikimate kinase [Halanaeroarchaeum sp. HSR-CO]UWG48308.1 Archaeal shikimate kinase [Halanaeroarchaeum sp. HSR-CO]
MDGRAEAPAAGTVLNALATGTGSAFAIDEYVRASVSLGGSTIDGSVDGVPDADTRLIERSAELVIDEFGNEQGASVETDSAVPMASGLKSSSAAANAVVLATLDALGALEAVTREDAARIGVAAARDVGVTATGAFDDASASMLGGVTVTNNDQDALLVRDEVDWDVVVWTPPEQAFSADADVERCRHVAPMADLVAELALAGRYETAMTVNGFAFAAALDQPAAPMVEALPMADGVSLSGTGPSYVAVGDREKLAPVVDVWEDRPGTVIETTTQTNGAGPI